MDQSKDVTEVLGAFVRSLWAIENVRKERVAQVGKFSYRYVDLTDALEVVRDALEPEGCALIQEPASDGGDWLHMTTTVLHTSGQWIRSSPLTMRLPADAQALGSLITYMRRYQLMAMFAIGADDDDGQAAKAAVAKAPPSSRTPDEAEIRTIIEQLPDSDRDAIQEQFVFAFDSKLSQLPPERHADALAWVKQWTAGDTATV